MKNNILRLGMLSLALLSLIHTAAAQSKNNAHIELSGIWNFQVDSLDKGVDEKWFNKELNDKIKLPGSMTTNGKGNDITVNTKWTGQIVDKSWFTSDEYAKYRQPDNIKIPFWLQPTKSYVGAAWYQKTVNIPAAWKNKRIQLLIERSHWETTVWVDGVEVGTNNSLATAQLFDLGNKLTPGSHRVTVKIDNSSKSFKVGENAHSISDHTQTNWNGMVGELSLIARANVFIDDVQLYPDVKNKQVLAKIQVKNTTGAPVSIGLNLLATANRSTGAKLKPLSKNVIVAEKERTIEMVYPIDRKSVV